MERHTMSAKTQERLDIQPEKPSRSWGSHFGGPISQPHISTHLFLRTSKKRAPRWHVMDTWLETAGLGLVFSAQTFQEPKWSMALNSLHTVERTSHKQLHCPASARKLGSSRAM